MIAGLIVGGLIALAGMLVGYYITEQSSKGGKK